MCFELLLGDRESNVRRAAADHERALPLHIIQVFWSHVMALFEEKYGTFKFKYITLYFFICVTQLEKSKKIKRNDDRFFMDELVSIKCLVWQNTGLWNGLNATYSITHASSQSHWPSPLCVKRRGRKTAVHMCWCIMLIHLFIASKQRWLVFSGLWINCSCSTPNQWTLMEDSRKL